MGAILEAAEEMFAEKGLHGAHMGDIASRAGVAVGTLYNHFDDREALLAGLLDARRVELLGRIDEGLRASADQPFRDRLNGLLEVMLAHGDRHRRFLSILFQGEVGHYQAMFPTASTKPSEAMKEICGRLDRLMKEGVEAGALRPGFADLAAPLFLGMVRTVCIRGTMSQTSLLAERDRLTDFFLEGAGS